MTREELAHILRAAAKIADDPGILVIGSQSILGSYPEQLLPEPVWLAMEADIAFLDDPDAHKADLVDGAIGELSSSPSWLLCARRTVFSESVQGVEPREARTDNDCVVVLLVLVHVTDRSSVEPSLPLLIGT
jgi:hypothetical protein